MPHVGVPRHVAVLVEEDRAPNLLVPTGCIPKLTPVVSWATLFNYNLYNFYIDDFMRMVHNFTMAAKSYWCHAVCMGARGGGRRLWESTN